MLHFIYKLIFWLSLTFLVMAIGTFTIGQSLSYEFRDPGIKNIFYDLIFTWTPIAILLTLFGTIRQKHSRDRKGITIAITLAIFILYFFIRFSYFLFLGVSEWSTNKVVYENYQHPQQQIREQSMEGGVFGKFYRVAEVQPFTGLFWKVTLIDTTTLDTTKWKRVPGH